MEESQQLEYVGWIRLLCRREHAEFVGNAEEIPVTFGLRQNRRNRSLLAFVVSTERQSESKARKNVAAVKIHSAN